MSQYSARNTVRFLAVVLCLVSIQFSTIATAGEFKISRYIEPNQMSGLRKFLFPISLVFGTT